MDNLASEDRETNRNRDRILCKDVAEWLASRPMGGEEKYRSQENPALPSHADQSFRVLNWNEIGTGCVLASFSLVLPSGLILHNCTLCGEDGELWVRPPNQLLTHEDGESYFVPVIEFASPAIRERFQRAALQAIAAFSAKTVQEAS